MLGTVMKVLAIALAAGAPLAAGAQAWPATPVRMLVPFPPGGGVDFAARIVGKHLSDRLGQQVVVENRAGANGIIALEALKGAAPDGYTIAAASNGPLVINPAMYLRLPYDPLRDFVAIGSLVSFPLLLVVHPSVPANSVNELIALARAKPGALTFSSPGVGNGSHLAVELFAAMADVQLVHVPYKGTAPAATALLAGEVALTFSSIPTALPHVRVGKLRAPGVGNAAPMAESAVPGHEACPWAGATAPTGTPRDVVVRLNREIVQVRRQKDVADQLVNEGTVPTPDTPEEFAAYIKSELGKWGAIVRLAKIKPE